MKIIGNLGFNVVLEATIDEKSPMGSAVAVLNTQTILNRARDFIAPILHGALKTAADRAKFLGIQIKVLESHIDLLETER